MDEGIQRIPAEALCPGNRDFWISRYTILSLGSRSNTLGEELELLQDTLGVGEHLIWTWGGKVLTLSGGSANDTTWRWVGVAALGWN